MMLLLLSPFSRANIGIWHIKSNVSVWLIQWDRLADAVAVVVVVMLCCCLMLWLDYLASYILDGPVLYCSTAALHCSAPAASYYCVPIPDISIGSLISINVPALHLVQPRVPVVGFALEVALLAWYQQYQSKCFLRNILLNIKSSCFWPIRHIRFSFRFLPRTRVNTADLWMFA